jgi:hypothetical protein
MRVVSQPFNMPTASSVAMPAPTPKRSARPRIAIATVTVERPATAPTERSISPAVSTKVMAISRTNVCVRSCICQLTVLNITAFKT